MPIEIRRFGVGHRRPDGPPGTTGVTAQVIHSDARGTIAELAFAREARLEPYASPNTTWFVVIEGGGWVGVDEERARIAAGEAVLWPADVPHAAWTEYSEMRAFIVEFAMTNDEAIIFFEGRARELGPGEAGRDPAARGIGALDPNASGSHRPEPDQGEPA